jgi:hypothetical protein
MEGKKIVQNATVYKNVVALKEKFRGKGSHE